MASVLDLIRSQFGKKKPGPTEAELSALVEQPTPAHLWFTPEGGWPEPFRGDARPPSLLPTAADAPDLFLLPAPIGELQVEVLEAINLRKADFYSDNDVNAVVVFEGAAGITTTLVDAARPRWHPTHARAFRFPARKPHSRFYVALFDEDFVGDDDPLGRVEISLASLHPNTVYDVWAPLQNSPFTLHRNKYGKVRLRFSIRWYSNSARIFRYPAALSGGEAPDVLPFQQRRWLMAALFATQGPPIDKSFKWSICRARINEAVEVFSIISLAQRAIKSLICYRRGNVLTSLLCGLVWQLCCVQPNFLASCSPLLLLAILSVTHAGSDAHAPGARSSPGAGTVTRAALSFLLGAPRGRAAEPPGDIKAADESDEDSDDEEPPTYAAELAKARLERLATRAKAAAAPKPRNRAASRAARAAAPPPAVSPGAGAPLAVSAGTGATPPVSGEAPSQLDEDLLNKGLAGALDRQRKEAEARRPKWQALADNVQNVQIDFLSSFLAPYQAKLGEKLFPLRSLRGLFEWRDPIVTWWLVIALWAAAMVLALIPWQRVFQALGFVLLGPHMMVVGRIPAVKRAFGFDEHTSPAALALRFKQASPDEKKRMLQEALQGEDKAEAEAKAAEDARMRKQLEKEKSNLEQVKRRFNAIIHSRYPLAIPSHPLTFHKHRHAVAIEESRTYPAKYLIGSKAVL